MMNFIAAVNPATWNKLNDWGLNMVARMAGKQTTDPEVQKIRKFATDTTNAVGGTLAGSMTADPKSKPPFVLRYVVGLKDAQAFSRAMEQMPSLFDSGLVADVYKQFGMKLTVELQRKAETYKDVPIDNLKFTFAATDSNSPQAQMISAMYGQGMNVRLAVTNNLLLYAVAADSTPIIKELIDQAKNSATTAATPSEIQAATQLIPGSEKADFLVTYNILRQLQMMSAIAPMPIAGVPAAKSQSNIALAGSAANGRLAIQIALPKQHLQELMGAFMQMQQQMQQQQQPQEQGQDQTEKKDET
jgi:hypothetical protein